MMKSRVFLLCSVLLGTSAAFATTDKIAAMGADESVAKSERQAVLNFGRLWIQDQDVTLPVSSCPHEKECRSRCLECLTK